MCAVVDERRWLSVKPWLVHKKRKVVLASRRRWKTHWVMLRGTRLFFHVAANQPCPDEHILTSVSTEVDQSAPELVLGRMSSLASWRHCSCFPCELSKALQYQCHSEINKDITLWVETIGSTSSKNFWALWLTAAHSVRCKLKSMLVTDGRHHCLMIPSR